MKWITDHKEERLNPENFKCFVRDDQQLDYTTINEDLWTVLLDRSDATVNAILFVRGTGGNNNSRENSVGACLQVTRTKHKMKIPLPHTDEDVRERLS